MNRLERLVVHVEEAIRLGTASDEAHVRLGLMLIDSAAELLMYRETNYMLAWSLANEGLLERAVRYDGDRDYVDELRGQVFSKTKRAKIERYFDAKCDVLVKCGQLPEAYARVLKKLHEYRNETYHRDELRPATLVNSVSIYIYLVCNMMGMLPMHSFGYSSSVAPAAIARYLEPGQSVFALGFELQGKIGQEMLRRSGISDESGLGEMLAEHVDYRIDDIDDALKECASFFNEINDRGMDAESVLGMLQAPEPEDPIDHLRRTADQYRGWARPVNTAKLRCWRKRGVALAREADDLVAFAKFADLEDEFEPIERQVMKLMTDVDHEIQHQVDRATGK